MAGGSDDDFVAVEAGIRQLQARYVDAVWRKDYAAFGNCFTDDVEWRISGQVIRGRENAVTYFRSRLERSEFILLTLRNPIIDIDNGTVTARTYFTAHNRLKDGTPFTPIGVYFERCVKQGDAWKFAWRHFQTFYAGPPDLSGEFIDQPDYGPPPAMPPPAAIPIR